MLSTMSPLSRRAMRRTARAAAVLAAVVLAGACSDDEPTGVDDEPEIESVRLTVTPASGSAATYVVTANGATPSPVQLRVGTSTITAVGLGANGQALDLASDFELRMSGLPASATFTRNGTLTATVTATVAVATPATVQAIMWHKVEQHDDYTASFPLTVVP